MTIYEAIKQRRKELGYSQEKLAEMVGYADKTAIAKIEKGVIDLPQSKIIAFATALRVSPGDLLDGSINDPPTYDTDLTTDERVLLEWYRNAPEHDRDFIRRMMAYNRDVKKEA